MFTAKPTSRSVFFSLLLLLLLAIFTAISLSSEPTAPDEDIDDLGDLQELIALDEEADLSSEGGRHESKDKPSGAELLSRAQRIVLELNSDNAKRAIDGNEYVLVLGYAPWSETSAELMPRFAEAATALKESGSPVLMAKVDAERHPKIASNLGIKGFPTMLLFVNGSSQPYTGGFSAQEIVIWTKKKTGAPVLRINSINEATGILQKHSMFVVGLFEGFEGPDYEEYKKAAQIDNEIQFIETSSAEILKVLFPDAKPAKLFLGLVKSEPEKYTSFEGTFNANEILQFLEDNKFPLVSVLTELNSAKVFSSASKLQVFVFAEPDAFKELLEPLQGVAKEYKSKIMLIYADIRDDNLVKPFLTLFGLEEPKDIVVIAFNYTIGSKYLLESTATPRSIKGFCLGVLDGTVPPYYKSQPAPDNKDASILAVVGKTFDDLILNSQKNILLEVHTPWCITCDTTSKQMEKLAKHFKGLENLVFARIDASENEHPKLQVDDYPALLFYSARDKSNPIKFPTKSSLKDLATLINKRLKEQDAEIKDEL
ncbi:PREDICTED: protein disulfide isomerase-like 1-6 isoform X1 [Ipomoea nil]|uniref:protein disulfide isomerase-like 1-6 isoform X1 n=1 Tax=Ipomoea nil TaxID=35883 RepID=UPI000901F9DE|nr:PREDICTED: protein disulfide isomerase-like 1-6 isoform X1 [Ipomoea nil]